MDFANSTLQNDPIRALLIGCKGWRQDDWKRRHEIRKNHLRLTPFGGGTISEPNQTVCNPNVFL